MERVSDKEVERMAAARALLLHGPEYSGEALALERQRVRERLASMGHPLGEPPVRHVEDVPPVYGDRLDWRNW
jgi:hypothetical protein